MTKVKLWPSQKRVQLPILSRNSFFYNIILFLHNSWFMLLPATCGQLTEVAVLMLQTNQEEVAADSYHVNHRCCRMWCGLLRSLQKPGNGCFRTLTSNFCLCILIISFLLHLFCQIVFSLEALWVKFYVHSSSLFLVICPPQFFLNHCNE